MSGAGEKIIYWIGEELQGKTKPPQISIQSLKKVSRGFSGSKGD